MPNRNTTRKNSLRIIPETAKGAFWLSFCMCFIGTMFIILVLIPVKKIPYTFGKTHDGYIQLADNLRQGNGYVFEKGGPAVFHRAPMYPLLLVPVTFFPEFLQRPVLVLIQSLMVGCIGGLIFKIGKHLFGGRTAVIAVFIFILNPWVYFNVKNPMTTITQGLLYTLFVALAGREFLIMLGRHDTPVSTARLWLRRLAIGAAGAALALTHGATLAVAMVLLLIFFIFAVIRRNGRAIKTSIAAAITMVILIAPWTYRNWVVFGRFIPIAGGGGLAYFNGSTHWKGIMPQPQREGEGYIDASLRVAGIEGTEETLTHWKGFKDIKLEDKMNAKMIEDLCAHPAAFAKKVLLNAVEYYFPALTYPFLATDFYRGLHTHKKAITIYHLALWLLALMGSRPNKKENISWVEPGLMLAAVVLYAIWFFPFATFIGHSLYAFGTIPFLTILAARGLSSSVRYD